LIRVQTTELVARAAEIDPTVTERTLEFWRHQGLLPHPERSGQNGKTPLWTYPPEAVDQLEALMRLRARTKDPNALRTALWYEGYPIDAARVRKSISVFLRQILDGCERELAKRSSRVDDPEARWEAIRAIAKVIAGKRGKGLPRLSRQALSERIDAISLTLGMVLGDEQAMHYLEADAPAVERLIGVERGRRFRPNGVRPWLDGPAAEGLQGFARFGNLPRLIAVVDGATDEELHAARNFARILLGGISAFSRIADAMVGRDNASGMAGMRLFDGDPHAPIFAIPLLLSVLESTEMAENLSQVIRALQSNVLPLEQRVKELLALPVAERADRLENLEKLPFSEQVPIKRLLAEFDQPPG
jgi:DNA-binding transcriptional MerR regulator